MKPWQGVVVDVEVEVEVVEGRCSGRQPATQHQDPAMIPAITSDLRPPKTVSARA
jgi:hypothetical protein